jgi:hypothetical protein
MTSPVSQAVCLDGSDSSLSPIGDDAQPVIPSEARDQLDRLLIPSTVRRNEHDSSLRSE